MFSRTRNLCISFFSALSSASAAEEIAETSSKDLDFVEIGYVSDVHGLEGEIRVKHNTDFPDLRFGTVCTVLLNLEFVLDFIFLGFHQHKFNILLSRAKDGCGNNILEEMKLLKLRSRKEEAIQEVRVG